MRIHRSIHIAADSGRIWPLLIDPEKIQQWCPPVRTIRFTGEQKHGIGTRFYFEEKAGGQLLKLHMIVTEWKQNVSIAFEMAAGNLVKSYSQRYVIKTMAQGSHVTVFEEVRLPYGIIGSIAGLFRRPVSNAHLDRMLAKLKNLSEVSNLPA
jgi:uncharacterized protein YndB with AHSA1/START domain